MWLSPIRLVLTAGRRRSGLRAALLQEPVPSTLCLSSQGGRGHPLSFAIVAAGFGGPQPSRSVAPPGADEVINEIDEPRFPTRRGAVVFAHTRPAPAHSPYANTLCLQRLPIQERATATTRSQLRSSAISRAERAGRAFARNGAALRHYRMTRMSGFWRYRVRELPVNEGGQKMRRVLVGLSSDSLLAGRPCLLLGDEPERGDAKRLFFSHNLSSLSWPQSPNQP
jgi:hypothetical protein